MLFIPAPENEFIVITVITKCREKEHKSRIKRRTSP
jgi:hypothetical protein